MSRESRIVSRRAERTSTLVAHEAAVFIGRTAGVDSLITVIRAKSTSNGDRMVVFVSVFPVEKTLAALAFLARQRESFSEHLKTHTQLSPLPRIDFLPDDGSSGTLLNECIH